MINEIDILHERHSCDFACHSGKKTARLLGLVSYHHETIIELGKYCFDTLAEFPVCPDWWTPVLLIQPIRNLEGDVCDLTEILLNPNHHRHMTVRQ